MRLIPSLNTQGSSALRIVAEDTPFRGQAAHRYDIEGFDTTNNRAVRGGGFVPRFRNLAVIFASEDGAANDVVPDGVTIDALLAIVADHLQGLQSGPTGSQGKQLALEYIESARDVLAADAGAHQAFSHSRQGAFGNNAFARTGTTGSL